MDNFEQSGDQSSQNIESNDETELSHSDKMIGIFTEPGKTYESISKYPVKTIDWFLPFALLLLVVTITQFLIMSNKEIHFQIVDKQMTKMQQNFNKLVSEGKMTQEQADKQISTIQDRMTNFGPLQMVLTVVGIFIGGFIVFFIMCGIYYLFAKFILKGDGNYSSVLVASGLTSYIVIIQVIIAAILAFAFGRLFGDTSVAAFLDSDKTTFAGFIFSKLDVFSIWIYIVLSIGLAKMFKSKQTIPYFVVVFGIWIIGGLLFFLIAKAVPILSMFRG
ncbi:MAG: YIP1 family protein [Ignavibacteriaceae bacterium]